MGSIQLKQFDAFFFQLVELSHQQLSHWGLVHG